MRGKPFLLLIVAGGCGLTAMFVVQQVLSSEPQEADPNMGQVLVAARDISPGVPLKKTNTIFKKMPKSHIPTGAVTEKKQYQERALQTRAVKGEIIMAAKLGEKGVYGASASIPDEMRVVTVPVDQTKSHSGLIRPSDRVDVLVTYEWQRPTGGSVEKTRTVLEYIEVFAIDNVRSPEESTEKTRTHTKNISLLVTPKQANLLMLANNKGQLHLALRNKSDDSPSDVTVVDDSSFGDERVGFGRQKAQEAVEDLIAQKKPQKSQDETNKWQVVIYAGKEKRVEEVPLPKAASETKQVQSRLWQGLKRYFTGM